MAAERKPSLDGLRALAVSLVFCYHAAFGHPSGGFVGVDMFFVLSGFLITRLLLTELDGSRSVDLKAFYRRRLRRLAPAALAAVSLASLVVAIEPTARGTKPFWLAAIASLSATANLFPDRALGVLQPMWSLAIEEQFYVLWPSALVWLRNRRNAHPLIGILVIAGTSFLFGVVAQSVFGWDLYFVTVPRFAELMIGCALAVALDNEPDRRFLRVLRSPLIAPIALIGVLALALQMHIEAQPNFLGLLIAVGALTALVVGHCYVSDSALTRLLSFAPLAYIGTISYGIYAYHVPVALLLNEERTGWPGGGVVLLRASVTLALAVTSFEFLELPIRTRSRLAFGRNVQGSSAS